MFKCDKWALIQWGIREYIDAELKRYQRRIQNQCEKKFRSYF